GREATLNGSPAPSDGGQQPGCLSRRPLDGFPTPERLGRQRALSATAGRRADRRWGTHAPCTRADECRVPNVVAGRQGDPLLSRGGSLEAGDAWEQFRGAAAVRR